MLQVHKYFSFKNNSKKLQKYLIEKLVTGFYKNKILYFFSIFKLPNVFIFIFVFEKSKLIIARGNVL